MPKMLVPGLVTQIVRRYSNRIAARQEKLRDVLTALVHEIYAQGYAAGQADAGLPIGAKVVHRVKDGANVNPAPHYPKPPPPAPPPAPPPRTTHFWTLANAWLFKRKKP